ncbi:hypothetical protein J3Q64DRAFT_1746330 [Phycomyces blakesleeanus]|uniref:Secreted protein n=1 Tax=Phycomyces blakesleeanus TaxID=4837 RepID=A0ABR3AXW7_PHYBL
MCKEEICLKRFASWLAGFLFALSNSLGAANSVGVIVKHSSVQCQVLSNTKKAFLGVYSVELNCSLKIRYD